MDFLQINKFSELHNSSVIFCKTDFLLDEFNHINSLNHDVILITGNADYAITDQLINIKPKNIKKWYAQNALSNSEILFPLPIGLENKNFSQRDGHGIGYQERMLIKEKCLSRNLQIKPTKEIYANFNINTNIKYRSIVKEYCIQNKYIDWHDYNLSLENWFNTILDYKMIVCPAGNGVDTHRLWEVLYSKRIPITFKVGNYKIYEMYKLFPIIVLDNLNDLDDINLINRKYDEIRNKQYDPKLLTFEYWKNLILNNE